MAERLAMSQDLKSVKVVHGALDESPLRGGTIILRGVLSADTLKNLKVDDYQREALPLSSLNKLIEAVKRGDVLPDIDIGMRGGRTRDAGSKDDGWFLLDDCYIIDGQQRVNACIAVASQNVGLPVRLGATCHFNTDRTWERERFRVLNANRIKVSPNVLLRNLREDHPAIQALYGFTDPANTSFCLAGRVSWTQKMRRGDLLTACNFAKVINWLHGHIGSARGGNVDEVAQHLDDIADKITLSLMRENAKVFWNVIDEIWGIRSVNYKELAPQLKGTFLFTLARIFSNHTDFWRNAAQARLFIDVDTRRKLALFKLHDSNVINLVGSSGPAHNILYGLLVRHINSSRRKANWIKARPSADVEDPTDIETTESSQDEAA